MKAENAHNDIRIMQNAAILFRTFNISTNIQLETNLSLLQKFISSLFKALIRLINVFSINYKASLCTRYIFTWFILL